MTVVYQRQAAHMTQSWQGSHSDHVQCYLRRCLVALNTMAGHVIVLHLLWAHELSLHAVSQIVHLQAYDIA